MGYLTEGCKACSDWKDEKDCHGCGCHFPIMECPHFAAMVRGERDAD